MKRFLEYYLNENLDVGTENGNEKLPSFDDILEIVKNENIDSDDSDQELESYTKEILDTFLYLSKEKTIPIYRVVKADEVDLDPYGIGESWSPYLDSVKEFARMNLSYNDEDELKIISGLVTPNNIDWEETIKLYTQFSSLMDSDSEFELRIPPNRKILDVVVQDFKTAKEIK